MIKFFKIFINMLYAFFTMGMIAIVVWGANWMVNTGGESYDVPNLVSNLDDDVDRTIYFSDIISFDAVSISNATRSHEIFLGDTDEYILWRAVPVHWLNVSMTWVKNVTIAVLSPSYEIEQMERYRYSMFITKLYPDDLTSDVYVVIDPTITYVDINGMTVTIRIDKENYNRFDTYGIVYGDKDNPIEIGTEFTYQEVTELGVLWRFDTPIEDLSLNDTAVQFNEVSKYDKYNLEDYDQFEKFITNKPVAKWAFAEIIIIVIITGFVVYQNPIDFTRNESGVTEINRTFLPRLPLPKRRVPRRFREDYEDEREKHRSKRRRNR